MIGCRTDKTKQAGTRHRERAPARPETQVTSPVPWNRSGMVVPRRSAAVDLPAGELGTEDMVLADVLAACLQVGPAEVAQAQLAAILADPATVECLQYTAGRLDPLVGLLLGVMAGRRLAAVATQGPERA